MDLSQVREKFRDCMSMHEAADPEIANRTADAILDIESAEDVSGWITATLRGAPVLAAAFSATAPAAGFAGSAP